MRYSRLLIVLGLAVFSSVASAQDALNVGLQDEAQVQRATETGAEGKVYILNSNSNAADTRYQNQPPTYVEASPLTESRADQLRRARRDAEVQTEVKIVEKLETSRLEDERRRSEALFGDRWGQLDQSQQQTQAAPAPAVQQQPAAVTVIPVQEVKSEEAEKLDKEELKSEIISEINKVKAEAKAEEEKAKETSKGRFYMGGLIGAADYVDAYNVENDLSAGVVVGGEVSPRVIVEGAFIYSKSYVDDSYWADAFPLWKRMDQYNWQLALKYSLLENRMIRPLVGGVVSYTYRKYTDIEEEHWHGEDVEEGTSNSIDFGVVLGLDFNISEDLSIGVDYRYMYNLTSNNDSKYLDDGFYYDEDEEPLEDMNYSLLSVSAKFRF